MTHTHIHIHKTMSAIMAVSCWLWAVLGRAAHHCAFPPCSLRQQSNVAGQPPALPRLSLRWEAIL